MWSNSFYDAFPGAEDSWTGTNTVTCCGSLGCMLGGYSVLGAGAEVEKKFEPLATHTQVRVTFDFVKIDTWDGEVAYMYIDDELVWNSGQLWYHNGEHSCGNSWFEEVIRVDVAAAHTAETATVKITTNIDSGAADESWGIQAVQVMTLYPSPPSSPAVQN